MRLTIIPSDGAVYKNLCSYSGLDLSFAPSDVHALQWYETYGEIEFERQVVDGQIIQPQNQSITVLPDWANQAIAIWEQMDAARIAAEKMATQEQISTLQNDTI
jgi:hypothetical protein